MKIDVFCGDFLLKKSDFCVLTHREDRKRFQGSLAAADKAMEGAIEETAERKGFKGSFGTCIALTQTSFQSKECLVLGLGNKKELTLDRIRQLGAKAVQTAEGAKAKRVVFPIADLQDATASVTTREMVHALAEGVLLAAYRFHAYHGTQTKKSNGKLSLKTVTLVVEKERDVKFAEEAIQAAEAIAAAVHLTRDLVNTTSADMTPSDLAKAAEAVASESPDISCKTLSKAQMEKLKMNAALAVARGSVHEPVGVHMTYTPPGKSKKTVAIVGKGVTFDSGGLSLKPAKGMESMKCDMAGAATVIGLFKALQVIRPNVTVHGIFLAVENMPGAAAYRPGDVVTAMDGTTIEVLNTDAEGRLTLADALSYATKQDPDMIVDLATLTGACIVALGDEVAALLSSDSRLAKRLLDAAEETGEPLWELPLRDTYAPLMKSKIADLKNISGTGGAGTITAALFLKPFVGDVAWAHLDIAGPSYMERVTRADIPYGGTGYGVRLLSRFLDKL